MTLPDIELTRSFPSEEHRIINERMNPSGKIKLLLGGGTIFSEEESYIRIGKSKVKDASEYLVGNFPEFRNLIDPDEITVYDGLSEDINKNTLQEIESKVITAVNGSPDTNSFVMFVGSDMTEEIGTHLSSKLSYEFAKHNIQLMLAWANHPVPNPEANHHIKRALEATQEKRPGGVYIVSGEKIIPAEFARKETWHGPMRFYDYTNKEDVAVEETRRNLIGGLSNKLSIRFFDLQIIDLIEYMINKRDFGIKRSVPVFTRSEGKLFDHYFYSAGISKDTKQGQFLWNLATHPDIHQEDPENKIIIRKVNCITDLPKYEDFIEKEVALFILNHSATTSREIAEAIHEICKTRADEGNPIAAFAVTENGEPHNWNPKSGIYPSGNILKDYVILLPSHIKPVIVKLWAALYKYNLHPNPELIMFMLNNFDDEVFRTYINYPDVQLVLKNVFGYFPEL